MIIQTNKQLQPRADHDFYPTPLPHALAALDTLPCLPAPTNILDAGAGTGVWGKASRVLWGHHHMVTGIELRDVARPKEYNFWFTGDFRLYRPEPLYDLVIGNPPYKYAEQFARLALDWLEDGGNLVYLLRLAFLEGQARGRGFWQQFPPKSVHVCIERPSFTGNGKTDATAYAIYHWVKGYRGDTSLRWLDTSKFEKCAFEVVIIDEAA